MKFLAALLVICISSALGDDTALKEFTSGNNLFTTSIYKEIKKTSPGNFLVSPFSAESVLALAQSGAKDETALEMRNTLHLPDSPEKIQNAIKSIHPQLKQSDLYTLKTANKIYLKTGFEVRDEFKKVASDVFEAGLENIDFSKKEEAAQTMNQWVEDQTEHKIQNLISPGSLNSRTRAILINALYFKGNWTTPFKKFLTKNEDFYKNGKQVAPVPTMNLQTPNKYYESEELKAKFLELPFEGGDVSMIFVLPNEKDGLEALENQLEKTVEFPKLTEEFVKISLPKFQIRSQFTLIEMLQELGMKKVFKGDEADLSGIAGKKGDLVIDQVVQKTFIDLNEDGVEAAAATFVAVGVPLSGVITSTSPPKEFKADHPFLFYIKIKDLILFAGRVVDPTDSK
ncbi:antichymotrypsin-2-like [Tribolium madens]|uniref:antichymotrypsin-2-like n=1 Tax=Tribolium madens TaxID=41895 RepID=UPI001CF73056|nr:antichymotrypsin-2-like [Tribolium madens]